VGKEKIIMADSKSFRNINLIKISALLLCLALLTGCALDLHDQPRYESFEKSTFFGDSQSARPRIPDTVAHDRLRVDPILYAGQFNNDFAPTFPFTVTLEVLERGQDRFDIFCAPCHGRLGDGQGIMAEYDLDVPTFHTPELRQEPPGYYFDIITRGTRVMPSYASRISPADRWAIIAYIRALQLSQNADLSNVPPQEVPNLDNTEVITR
jgi:hypothetical protein